MTSRASTVSEEELSRLIDLEGPRLLAFARRSCGDGSQAEDVVQETFVQAYRAWDQLEDPSAARAWIYAIARRVCQRMTRRRAGEPARLESIDELEPRPTPTVPELAAEDDPHRERLRAEARELVERGLAALPEAFRVPLVLADIAELSVAEIAAVLGLKEATVKTRLHRARLKLRTVLAEGLPQRPAPPPPHDRSVCLDLLRAKLEAMDRHAPFPYSDQALCERCRTLLDTVELAGQTCAALTAPEVPPALRARVMAAARS